MEIHKKVFDLIAKAAEKAKDHEIGGILGADKGDFICQVVIDNTRSNDWYTYTPNVELLNEIIARWDQCQFIGFFHSHLNNQNTLSVGDRSYIRQIIRAMPSEIIHLYFPLYVIPENKLYGFKAQRVNDEIIITEDPVNII